jgi:hypothetical protein
VVFIPVMTAAYVDLPREQMPNASAITRIVQQLGGAFGTALIAVVLSAATSAAAPAAGFQAAFWWATGITVASAAVGFLLPSGRGD